jgi:hypothetical protein
MEKTTADLPPPARDAEPEETTPPAAAPAPPAGHAAVRAVARRWPRSVPETRVFPRG